MKKPLLACLLFTLCLSFSCGPSAKLQISKNFDKLAASRKTEKEDVPLLEASTTENIIAFPPALVQQHFQHHYPIITHVVWAELIPPIKLLDDKNIEYRARFHLDADETSLIYSKEGVLIETRTKMSVSTLSADLKLAIERKYPGASLIDAFAFKSIRSQGAYGATISQMNLNNRLEILMMEDGTFVE